MIRSKQNKGPISVFGPFEIYLESFSKANCCSAIKSDVYLSLFPRKACAIPESLITYGETYFKGLNSNRIQITIVLNTTENRIVINDKLHFMWKLSVEDTALQLYFINHIYL